MKALHVEVELDQRIQRSLVPASRNNWQLLVMR
jgi:hypothetical protein